MQSNEDISSQTLISKFKEYAFDKKTQLEMWETLRLELAADRARVYSDNPTQAEIYAANVRYYYAVLASGLQKEYFSNFSSEAAGKHLNDNFKQLKQELRKNLPSVLKEDMGDLFELGKNIADLIANNKVEEDKKTPTRRKKARSALVKSNKKVAVEEDKKTPTRRKRGRSALVKSNSQESNIKALENLPNAITNIEKPKSYSYSDTKDNTVDILQPEKIDSDNAITNIEKPKSYSYSDTKDNTVDILQPEKIDSDIEYIGRDIEDTDSDIEYIGRDIEIENIEKKKDEQIKNIQVASQKEIDEAFYLNNGVAVFFKATKNISDNPSSSSDNNIDNRK